VSQKPRRTARAITVTRESLVKQWQDLFDANPWLEGLTTSQACDESVFCCPSNSDIDWLVLSEASEVLFLATGASRALTLRRDMLNSPAPGGE